MIARLPPRANVSEIVIKPTIQAFRERRPSVRTKMRPTMFLKARAPGSAAPDYLSLPSSFPGGFFAFRQMHLAECLVVAGHDEFERGARFKTVVLDARVAHASSRAEELGFGIDRSASFCRRQS